MSTKGKSLWGVYGRSINQDWQELNVFETREEAIADANAIRAADKIIEVPIQEFAQ